MSDQPRSRCTFNRSLELFGDQWTLLIVRDLMFGGKRHFRELLASEEHIASNVLAERLKRLVEAGLLSRSADPRHRQKAIYRLTEAGIGLVPVLATIGAWGSKHLPNSGELSARARLLADGGPPVWEAFMAELREEHLAPITIGPAPSSRGPSAARLQRVHESVIAQDASPATGSAAGGNAPEHAIVNAAAQLETDYDRIDQNGGGGT